MCKQVIENALDFYRAGLLTKLKIARINNHSIEIELLTHELDRIEIELLNMNSIFLNKKQSNG